MTSYEKIDQPETINYVRLTELLQLRSSAIRELAELTGQVNTAYILSVAVFCGPVASKRVGDLLNIERELIQITECRKPGDAVNRARKLIRKDEERRQWRSTPLNAPYTGPSVSIRTISGGLPTLGRRR